MPQMILEIPPYLQDRINDWSSKYHQSPEKLAVKLFDEYFDDCDEAARLEAEILGKENEPNAETIAALNEYYEMINNPTAYKSYDSFADILADLENETKD